MRITNITLCFFSWSLKTTLSDDIWICENNLSLTKLTSYIITSIWMHLFCSFNKVCVAVLTTVETWLIKIKRTFYLKHIFLFLTLYITTAIQSYNAIPENMLNYLFSLCCLIAIFLVTLHYISIFLSLNNIMFSNVSAYKIFCYFSSTIYLVKDAHSSCLGSQ